MKSFSVIIVALVISSTTVLAKPVHSTRRDSVEVNAARHVGAVRKAPHLTAHQLLALQSRLVSDATVLEREIHEMVVRAADESTDESGAFSFSGLVDKLAPKVGDFIEKNGAKIAGNAIGSFLGSKSSSNSNQPPPPPQVVTVTSPPPSQTSSATTTNAPLNARDTDNIRALAARAVQDSTTLSSVTVLAKPVHTARRGDIEVNAATTHQSLTPLSRRVPDDAAILEREIHEIFARAVEESTDESGAFSLSGLLGGFGDVIGKVAPGIIGGLFGGSGNSNASPSPPQVITVTSPPPGQPSAAAFTTQNTPPNTRDIDSTRAIVASALLRRDDASLPARRAMTKLFSREVDEMVARELLSTLTMRAYQQASKREYSLNDLE